MQTMRARAKESQQEDNAFKALEAVATTSSENYKDDATYEQYRETHADVMDRECNFTTRDRAHTRAPGHTK